ncbi:hypothetical protein ACKFKF_34285 [Phormidesmis sp. 146-12]
MKNLKYQFAKPFFLMVFSFFLITACYQPITQKTNASLTPTSECRMIQHVFGKTCIPFVPQRIVALNPMLTLDPLIALSIRPFREFTSETTPGFEVISPGLFQNDSITG